VVKLFNEDTAEMEGLMDVAMATNFGTTDYVRCKWTLTRDNDMMVSYKGSLVFSQYVGRSVWKRSCGDRNCSRRATVPLGTDTLIANILVFYLFRPPIFRRPWADFCETLPHDAVCPEIFISYRGVHTCPQQIEGRKPIA